MVEKVPRFSRVEWSVTTDPKLSAHAVRVYNILAGQVFEGRTTAIGIRRIGKLGAMGKNTAQGAVLELIERGHVSVKAMGSGKRSLYILNSPLFGQKQGKVNVVASHPKTGRKRMVSVAAEA